MNLCCICGEILSQETSIKVNSEDFVCCEDCLKIYNQRKNDVDFSNDIRDICSDHLDF